MDAQPKPVPLKISSLGLEESEFRALQNTLDVLRNEGMNIRSLAQDDPDGHLVVVNTESAVGQNQLAQLRPGQVKLIFSSQPVSGRNQISLLKPISESSLNNVLHKLCRQMQSQLQSQQLQQKPQEKIASQTRNSKTLLETLMQSKSEKNCMRIQHSCFADIYIDGNKQTLISSANSDDIVKTSLQTSAEFKTEIITESDIPTGADSLYPLTNILWELAINSADEILPAEISKGTPLKLKAWPNFTRQGFKPEHFKIAAIMARQAISQNALYKCLQLEPETVTSFINGCFAVDLIEIKNEIVVAEEKPESHTTRMSEHSGLFKRIAARLGFSS